VLHNVRITEGSHVTGNAQFIQLSFTMPEKYTVAGANGELIPFSSVRIGKGKSMSSVVEWIKPCNVNVTGNGTVIPGIYGNPEIAAVYDTFSEVQFLSNTMFPHFNYFCSTILMDVFSITHRSNVPLPRKCASTRR
jgi:hypothetical protein